jgi:hypothetical protein
MRRFVIIDKFAEGTPFRGCDSHKREFEALGILILGVEFVDVELPTAGAEVHGFCKSESLQVSKMKHNEGVVMKGEKRWGRGDVVEVVWHSRVSAPAFTPGSLHPSSVPLGCRIRPLKISPTRPEGVFNSWKSW